MYQEIKSDLLKPIFQMIETALSAAGPIQITLQERDGVYIATLLQVTEEPVPPTD